MPSEICLLNFQRYKISYYQYVGARVEVVFYLLFTLTTVLMYVLLIKCVLKKGELKSSKNNRTKLKVVVRILLIIATLILSTILRVLLYISNFNTAELKTGYYLVKSISLFEGIIPTLMNPLLHTLTTSLVTDKIKKAF